MMPCEWELIEVAVSVTLHGVTSETANSPIRALGLRKGDEQLAYTPHRVWPLDARVASSCPCLLVATAHVIQGGPKKLGHGLITIILSNLKRWVYDGDAKLLWTLLLTIN